MEKELYNYEVTLEKALQKKREKRQNRLKTPKDQDNLKQNFNKEQEENK